MDLVIDDYLTQVSDLDGSTDDDEDSDKISPKTIPRRSKPKATPAAPEPEDSQPANTTPAKRRRSTEENPYPTPRRSTRVSAQLSTDNSGRSSASSAKDADTSNKKRRTDSGPATGGKSQPGPAKKEWEVEKILGSQIDAISYEHFYLVKWKGYGVQENTWEPKKNLANCKDAIRAFEEDSRMK